MLRFVLCVALAGTQVGTVVAPPGSAASNGSASSRSAPPAVSVVSIASWRYDLPRASRSAPRTPLAPSASARPTARPAPSHARTSIADVWARLAQCEASGDWAANTGNGFYGGLQFTLSTWRSYGGVGYPQDSSPGVQIAVARRVLAGQGVRAWPVCGPRVHLRVGD